MDILLWEDQIQNFQFVKQLMSVLVVLKNDLSSSIILLIVVLRGVYIFYDMHAGDVASKM